VDIETFAHVVAHGLEAPRKGSASMVDVVVEGCADRLNDEGTTVSFSLPAAAPGPA
jgi:hypothetical protein